MTAGKYQDLADAAEAYAAALKKACSELTGQALADAFGKAHAEYEKARDAARSV